MVTLFSESSNATCRLDLFEKIETLLIASVKVSLFTIRVFVLSFGITPS